MHVNGQLSATSVATGSLCDIMSKFMMVPRSQPRVAESMPLARSTDVGPSLKVIARSLAAPTPPRTYLSCVGHSTSGHATDQHIWHQAWLNNFNMIEEDDLRKITGLGKKKVALILNAFAVHGSFDSYDDVKNKVCGIGDKHIDLFKAFGWPRCEPVRCVHCGAVF